MDHERAAGSGRQETRGERRRPRLADVAAQVGLSPASVSLVLRNEPGPSEETRRRVFAAAAALGYRPDRTASSLARRRSRLLGVLIDVHNSFHAELVEHIDAAAHAEGYEVVLTTRTRVRSEAEAIESLLDFRCEALILSAPEMAPSHLMKIDASVPVVVVGRRLTRVVTDVVRSDDGAGVGQAVDHLVALGHQRIAFVDGGRGTIAADRRRGYRSAMCRHGLDALSRVVPGDHTEIAGARAAEVLVRGGDLPTAIVTSNDRCAVGLLDAFTRAGVRVPGEVSVVGFDDSPQSRWAHIELTTVSQEADQQAEHAVAAALERLQGRQTPREMVLTPRLVVRATTAPRRAGAEPKVANA